MAANIDWDTLKSALKNNKCVLFIGQDFLQTDEGKTLDDMLGRFLNHAHAELKPIYDQDGFLPLSKRNRNKAVTKVETFFEDIAPSFQDLYKTITLMPFRVVVNMTPDETLIEAFNAAKIPPIVDYYNQNDASAPKFDPKQPFIFNFSGKLSDEDSLVLTHADFYNHFKSKFAEQSLSRLRNALLDVRCAVFMGVPYNRYFMDLVFRDLRMHQADKIEKYLLTSEDVETVQRKSFYDDEFNMTFIKQSPAGFFKELIEKCGTSIMRRPENYLQLSANTHSVRKTFNAPELQNLIGEGKEYIVMKTLEDFYQNAGLAFAEFFKELILLKNQLTINNNNIARNLIDPADSRRENSRIVFALISLINNTAIEYQKITS